MNPKNSSRTIIFSFFVSALLLACAMSNVSALTIDSLRLDMDDSKLNPGQAFKLNMTFVDPSENLSNVEVDVTVKEGDVVLHQQTTRVDFIEGVDVSVELSSRNFKNADNDNVWEANLMNYKCGSHTLRVDVETPNEDISDYDTIDFDIDNRDLTYTITPSAPSLADEITVHVDGRNGNSLADATVKFTWLADKGTTDEWDYDDKYYSRNTNTDGDVKVILKDRFSSNSYGKYQLDLYKKDEYCLEQQVLNIGNSLNMSAEPASPKVGEAFKIRVMTGAGKPATGVKVRMSPGSVEKVVGSDGYTGSFVVTATDSYSFVASGGSYSETTFTLAVSQKPSLSVSSSPDPVELNKPVTLLVQSNGAAVAGASLSVSRSGGSTQTVPGTTGADGKITYTPTEVGEYTAKASKTGYDDGTDTFTVKNKFQVTLPAEDQLKVGNTVKISVKDQSGNPVVGASASVAGSSTPGSTDSAGDFSLILDRVGRFDVTFKKSGFSDESASLITKGTMSITVNPKQVEVGGSVAIKVTDAAGNLLPANIVVKSQSTIGQPTMASEYAYQTLKPGDYTVEASKQDYGTVRESFTVKPRTLSLRIEFAGDVMKVNATSHGQPASGVTLVARAPDGTESNLLTDDYGAAVLSSATQYGNYTVRTTSEDFAEASETMVREKSLLSGASLLLVVVLVIIVLLAIIAVVLLQMIRGRGGKSESMLYRPGRTKLSGL